MSNQIECRTLFDISATGVRSHYKESRIPFYDNTGKLIDDLSAWHWARNQQRNWETLNQIISLRTLPTEISVPQVEEINGQRIWTFMFEIESLAAISDSDNFASLLLADCNGVPMIVDLSETKPLVSTLIPETNIWFNLVRGKY